MSEAKHTPGPYEDRPQPGGQRYIYARGAGNGNGALIMQVLPLEGFCEEFEANVNLFCQVPDFLRQRDELLEALREHGIPRNPHGTFPDAMDNLANMLAGSAFARDIPQWVTWLRDKASQLRTAIANAEEAR